MLPKDVVTGMISVLFERGPHGVLSGVDFPPMTNFFSRMGYHFVVNNEDFQETSWVGIFKAICKDKDWDIVSGLGKRYAKKKIHTIRGTDLELIIKYNTHCCHF